jgi:hypothetical protein
MSSPGDIRLDSWKTIAAYLARDLKTVRRWEVERGLPVHRVPGGGRRAIYAFRHEIDAWLQDLNHPDIENNNKNPKDVASGSPVQPQPEITLALESEKATFPSNIGSDPATYQPQRQQALAPTNRSDRRFGFMMGLGVSVIITIVLSACTVWLFRAGRVSIAGTEPIEITAVSPILPAQNQTIVIHGSGFGLHTPYRNADTAFIAIRDKTAGWAAGRIIPQNWDEVTLNVESWEDAQIVITGFSGAYGSREWRLTTGDEIEIAVWNPQTSHGPALYHATVSASPPN